MASDIVGHESIWEYFINGLGNDKLSHAYLLAGEKGLGKTFFVKRLVQYIFCSDKNKPCLKCAACKLAEQEAGSDLLWLKPEEDKQTIPIEKIRQIKDFISLKSFIGTKRVVVIDEVDSMNEAASNALLKSLEEPPANVLFILIAHNAGVLLPTIKSRCTILNFGRLSNESISNWLNKADLESSDINLITELAYGRPALAMSLATSESLLQDISEQADKFCDILNNKDWALGQSIIAGELNEDKSYLASQTRLAAIMKIWQEVARDALLVKFGADKYLRYQNSENKLKLVGSNYTSDKLINIYKLINNYLGQLSYNPNLRLTVESLIAQIINL